ncbi:MAG: Holliday junction branch migration protein RuvA [Candidatus Zixiibacteriota bacterium]
MIGCIKGTLARITDDFALVENGGVYYEILLPSAVAERLKANGKVGSEIEFKTIYYIEAGDKKSNHYPKLVGFTSNIDREFFSLFTQVPGLGIKKALKSLILPIREIATAIETKDASTLNRLPGVGGRLADKIIAELHGKTSKFALSKTDEPLAKKEDKKALGPIEHEAVEVLLQLQYRRQEAEEMVARVIKTAPKVSRVEELISLIFRNEQQGRG